MKTIYIIDDDTDFLKRIEGVFSTQQYEVMHSTDGADGLAKLYMLDVVPSIILLGALLPVLNGTDVLKLLKKNDKLKDVPVVMLTNASTAVDSETEMLALGASAFMLTSENVPEVILKKISDAIHPSFPATDVTNPGTIK